MRATYKTEKDLESGDSIIIEVTGRHYMENEGADADGNRGHMEHGYEVESVEVNTPDIKVKRKNDTSKSQASF